MRLEFSIDEIIYEPKNRYVNFKIKDTNSPALVELEFYLESTYEQTKNLYENIKESERQTFYKNVEHFLATTRIQAILIEAYVLELFNDFLNNAEKAAIDNISNEFLTEYEPSIHEGQIWFGHLLCPFT